jgi:hypothetical protein
LAASGVAQFRWQQRLQPSPPQPTYPLVKKEPEETFHNPALAAIRASQQLQDHTNGSHDLEASIRALREMADDPDNENRWYNPPPGNLKRRLSQVEEYESQPLRTNPAIDPLPSIPPLHNPNAQSVVEPYYPPKRKPDPNDDTIGSDLDDSEDDENMASEDEDDDIPLMLCSYDKVHRTKNKWRANLSNGVVCINGREWVFEKGNGEYEW